MAEEQNSNLRGSKADEQGSNLRGSKADEQGTDLRGRRAAIPLRQPQSAGGSGPKLPPGRMRPVWVTPEPTPATVEELIKRFPEVVELSEEEIREETDAWLNTGLIAWSLGRRVSAEAFIREVRRHGGLKNEVSGYDLEEGFFILCFVDAKDRDLVLEMPWSVSRQTMAIEPWQPRFAPAALAIQTAVVWLRLPSLPVELWGRESLRRIISWAGDLVALDDCMSNRRRLGFARAAVRIRLTHPLRPGVLVAGPGGHHWQRFVYENLTGICLHCGMFHQPLATCAAAGVRALDKLHPDNVGSSMEQGEEILLGGRALGPWLLAVRQWLPSPSPREEEDGPTVSVKSAREKGKMLSAEAGPSAPVAPTDCDGWSKPSKIARRRSPLRPPISLQGGDTGSRARGFALLDDEGLGVPKSSSQVLMEPGKHLKNCPNVKARSGLSKRARSPVHMTTPVTDTGCRNDAVPLPKLVIGTGRKTKAVSGMDRGIGTYLNTFDANAVRDVQGPFVF